MEHAHSVENTIAWLMVIVCQQARTLNVDFGTMTIQYVIVAIINTSST